MTFLFDTNVILDVLLDRVPFSEPAAQLLAQVERGAIVGYMGATTITTIHYLATRAIGAEKARQEIGKLLTLFNVAAVNRPVLQDALDSEWADFEDAVLHEAARQAGAQGIVTRDLSGFKKADLPTYTPDEVLSMLEAG